MGTRQSDRLWIGGGAVVIVLLVLAGYFLLIKPKYDEADAVRGQTETSDVRLITLRRRLAELKEQRSKLAEFKSTLKTNQAALPADSGVPDFLRQLQASSDQVGVSVNGMSVNVPEPVPAAGSPTVYALPITVAVEGPADHLEEFVSQLQDVQPRAVLIESANLSPKGGDDSADSTSAGAASLSLSLSLKAFVAPPAGAGTPRITTTN
jgi:Tfp pilus assembly protein PilO